jgi:hypothetical protein
VTVKVSELHTLFCGALFTSPLYAAWKKNVPLLPGVYAEGEVYNVLPVTTSLPSTPPAAGVVHELSVNTLKVIVPVGLKPPANAAVSETEPLPKTIVVWLSEVARVGASV